MNTNYTIYDCTLIDVPTFTDVRGTISVLEMRNFFEVKRVFWLHHIQEGKSRGGHALLDSYEIIVAVHGSFVVELDDTVNKVSILLDDPSKGLVIRPGIWFRTHSYKNNGATLVLADVEYNRDGYIYDYEMFKLLKFNMDL